MPVPGILRVMLMAVVAFYVFSYGGSCIRNDAKAETMAPATGSTSHTLRVGLIRRDFPRNPFEEARNLSNAERLRRAIQRSHNKVRSLQKASVLHSTSYYSPFNYESYEFLMPIGIGSPDPLNLHFILDTGSDLIWTQCAPCDSNNSCVAQQDPLYIPLHSSSFRNDSCSSAFCKAVEGRCDALGRCKYFYMYGNSSSTTGNMAYETFSLRKVADSRRLTSFPDISFACGRRRTGYFSNSAGIMGMGRGPLSLVSQIGSSINHVFSYCLASIDNASQISPLFFGNIRLSSLRPRVAPLVQNKAKLYFYYYLRLRGITVAGKDIDVPKGTFEIKPNRDGGTIIDSGTSLTYLEDPAYQPFLKAVRSSIQARPLDGSSLGFDLCYNVKSAPVLPIISFHFGGGVEYVLPKQNSFVSMQDHTGDLVCLAFRSAGPAGSMSIIGNIQQQNFHITYDLGKNKLYFAHTNGASL